MKKIVLFLILINCGFVLVGQTNTITQTVVKTQNIDGKYGFIYNDNRCIVEFNSANSTFIEYTENYTQLTTGNFILTGNTYQLTPISKSPNSQINIPVSFKIAELTATKIRVVFNSARIKNYELNLYKL